MMTPTAVMSNFTATRMSPWLGKNLQCGSEALQTTIAGAGDVQLGHSCQHLDAIVHEAAGLV
jgi:hypothetical protein